MTTPRIAIGIRYRPSYPGPLLLFKAKGILAERVLELAQRYQIPQRTEEILGPVLFQLPEGSWIPEKHFSILAQLLTAVYHCNQNHENTSDGSL